MHTEHGVANPGHHSIAAQLAGSLGGMRSSLWRALGAFACCSLSRVAGEKIGLYASVFRRRRATVHLNSSRSMLASTVTAGDDLYRQVPTKKKSSVRCAAWAAGMVQRGLERRRPVGVSTETVPAGTKATEVRPERSARR